MTTRNYEEYDQEYYDILNVIDRLRDEVIRRYGSIHRASKEYGYSLNRLLYSGAYRLGFSAITNICKFLNVSYQWTIFGGDDKGSYIEQEHTFNNFYKVYKEVYKGNTDHRVYVCYHFASKHKGFPMKYLIKLAKKSKKTIDFLIGG